MSWMLVLKGIGAGLVLAIPIGPVGLLVFRRSLTHGARAGIIAGTGAAIADAVACAVMAFGITAISEFISTHKTHLNGFGAVALIAVGVVVFLRAPPRELKAAPPKAGSLAAITTSLLVTLTNPGTVLGVTVIFAGFGVAATVDTAVGATVLVLGVFTGSMLWWCTLSVLAGRFRDKASGYWMRRINQGCGLALALIGAVSLVLSWL